MTGVRLKKLQDLMKSFQKKLRDMTDAFFTQLSGIILKIAAG
jgi:hypothetical protein